MNKNSQAQPSLRECFRITLKYDRAELLFEKAEELHILLPDFGLRLLPKLCANFGDFANRRTQKSRVCVSDTQALQANKVAIVFYAHSLFLGDLCRIYVIYDYEAVSYRTS